VGAVGLALGAYGLDWLIGRHLARRGARPALAAVGAASAALLLALPDRVAALLQALVAAGEPQ
jgi:hypothetical protein